jgi:hypothetical protein
LPALLTQKHGSEGKLKNLANQDKALARKIATMYWNTLVKGVQFVEQGSASYEKKAAQSEQYLLRKLAAKHDMVLV